ncbi:MAG: PEGA domain-containing protein [Acidobacteriota bacterium]
MNLSLRSVKTLFQCLLLLVPLFLAGGLQARNEVLGQINFVAGNKEAKSSGVWVDGQYVGYLKELKGSKKVLLLPGKHKIEVREAGYKDFTREVTLGPGDEKTVTVTMQKDLGIRYGNETAEVKLSGQPERAAVFVDNQFVGHVNQFSGRGQGMLLTPGKHEIKISLPGYQPFDTVVNLRPHQKLKLKTDLMPARTGT